MFLKVPNLGEDFAEAKVVEWLVKEGDIVDQDQDVVELLTDKATFVVPAPFKMRLVKILKREGELIGEDMILAEIEEVEA